MANLLGSTDFFLTASGEIYSGKIIRWAHREKPSSENTEVTVPRITSGTVNFGWWLRFHDHHKIPRLRGLDRRVS